MLFGSKSSTYWFFFLVSYFKNVGLWTWKLLCSYLKAFIFGYCCPGTIDTDLYTLIMEKKKKGHVCLVTLINNFVCSTSVCSFFALLLMGICILSKRLHVLGVVTSRQCLLGFKLSYKSFRYLVISVRVWYYFLNIFNWLTLINQLFLLNF